MAEFRNIVFASVLAGLLAGLFVTLVQLVGTVPLILQAEVYENAAPPVAATHEHEEGWAPEDGVERTVYTVLANVVTGTAFALLLVAGYALRGTPVRWREGLLWGLGGFTVFMLAPSLGLPPELPGTPAAPLGPRQAWWALTALSTAAGLGLIAFRRSPLAAFAAILLIVAPHLVGAPQAAETATLVPESLLHSFIVAATVSSFLFWALLGVLTAVFFGRLRNGSDPAPAG